MKKIFLGALALSMVLYGNEAIQEKNIKNTSINVNSEQSADIEQKDIDEQNTLSDASILKKAKTVDDFFKDFQNEIADKYDNATWGEVITNNETGTSKTFYKAKEAVAFDPGDTDHAKGLSIAYDRALLNLQSEYIKDNFGKIGVQKLNQYINDDSTGADKIDPLPQGSTMEQIIAKIGQFAGAKLDQALRDLGIEPTNLTEERKKILFADKFTAKMLTNATGSMSGLVPVKTYVARREVDDGKYVYEVGIVAVISDITRQVARDMSYNRKSNIKGKGKKIREYLPQKDEDFLNEYGIRMVYDQNGAPIIISYSQWSFSYPANSKAYFIAQREQIAKDTASQKADAAIIEFIKTNINLVREGETGQNTEQSIKETRNLLTGESKQETFDPQKIIDKALKNIKANAKGDLPGIRTLTDWSVKDEHGIKRVGVVRFYSFKNYENSKKATTFNELKEEKKTAKTKQNTNSKSRESKMVNSLDDF